MFKEMTLAPVLHDEALRVVLDQGAHLAAVAGQRRRLGPPRRIRGPQKPGRRGMVGEPAPDRIEAQGDVGADRPDRLRQLVDLNFDRLELGPVESGQFLDLDHIDYPKPPAPPPVEPEPGADAAPVE